MRRWQLTSAPPGSACSRSSPTLLFGAVGVRLWFLQTVQAESLQQTVDARKTKTVRLVPERGRIFDADGRILADNERVLTVGRRLGRHPQRHRPGRSCSRGCRAGSTCRSPRWRPRYDAELYSRYLPLPLKEGVARERRHRDQRARRGLPRRHDHRDVEAGVPVRPAGQPRRSATWAPITADDEADYEELGYDTSVDGEKVGRAGVELWMEKMLHGKWGEVVYEVDANNRIVREISYEAPVNGEDIQLSIDLDCSSTPSGCCRPSCA